MGVEVVIMLASFALLKIHLRYTTFKEKKKFTFDYSFGSFDA
jgi:hypothetical protein